MPANYTFKTVRDVPHEMAKITPVAQKMHCQGFFHGMPKQWCNLMPLAASLYHAETAREVCRKYPKVLGWNPRKSGGRISIHFSRARTSPLRIPAGSAGLCVHLQISFFFLLPIQRTQKPILLKGVLGNLTHPFLHSGWELPFWRDEMTSLFSLLPEFLPMLKGRSRCISQAVLCFQMWGLLTEFWSLSPSSFMTGFKLWPINMNNESEVAFPGVSSFQPGAQVNSSPVGCWAGSWTNIMPLSHRDPSVHPSTPLDNSWIVGWILLLYIFWSKSKVQSPYIFLDTFIVQVPTALCSSWALGL